MNKDIYEFAKYYFNIFRNPQSTDSQVEEGFAEKCFALGFEMDAGNSLKERYPKAFDSAEELDKIIDEIDNPQFLGTAIFSQWRYITHWSYSSHPLDAQYRPWFICAFSRLLIITSDDKISPFVFFGNAKKVKIHSNSICFGYCPKKDDEVEQHLTITDDGRIWITRYAISEDLNFCKLKKTEQKQIKINPDKAKYLLSKFTEYFGNEYDMDFITDVGSFEMWIDDDNGKKTHFIGPLLSEFIVDDVDLSQLVRDTLDDQTLFVFNNNNNNKVKRITIDYRFTKAIPNDEIGEVVWDYKDRLVIDRPSETIEDVLQFAEKCDVTRKYHIAEGVNAFLDSFDGETLFTVFEQSEDDEIIPSPDGTSEYEVKVEFYKEKPRIISGKYDKYGLPKDWPKFIEALYDFISFYGFGEIFDENVYARTYRRKNEYIFLSVKFGDYGKPYYYLTDDDSIQVGNQVEVPVESDGKERIVTVTKKEYYPEDKVPMPLDKVKYIIGKFVPPQEDENGDILIYCPMCDKMISTDTCDDILYDLCDDIPGIITAEEIATKEDICKRCKYHEE